MIEIEIRTKCVAMQCEEKPIPIDRQGEDEVYCCDDCAEKDYNDCYDVQAAERAVGC